MAHRRAISWSAALRDMRDDRAKPAEVREERYLTKLSLAPGMAPLTAWRLKDDGPMRGRREVFAIYPVEPAPIVEIVGHLGQPVVALAIRRTGDDACAQPEVLSAVELNPAQVRGWTAKAALAGATELQVCRLADTPERRRAIVESLRTKIAAPTAAAA